MSIAPGRWQLAALADFHTHNFPDGLVIYQAHGKDTLYLPHPASTVFAILRQHPQGLEGTVILDTLASSQAPTSLTVEELEAVLGQLQQQRLVTLSE